MEDGFVNELLGFDFDEFANNDHENRLKSLSILRQNQYWVHFGSLTNAYNELFKINDKEIPENCLKMAHLHFLGGSSVDLVKGIANVLSGHLTDSSIYVRRTIESIRYSIFIRTMPDLAKAWFDPELANEFSGKYRSWIGQRGKFLLEAEFPGGDFHFKHSSEYGPHANAQLFSQQQQVSFEDGRMNLRIFYHELESSEIGYHQLLVAYFWHLRIHANAVNWWIKKSGLISHLTSEQIQFWNECHTQVERDDLTVREMVRNGPLRLR